MIGNHEPEVVLYRSNPDALFDMIRAARLCKNSMNKMDSLFDGTKLIKLGERDRKLLEYCIDHGHKSILEHADFSFKLNLSRVAHTQLVRHRISTFSAESARHVKVERAFTPKTIEMNPETLDFFIQSINCSFQRYHDLMSKGIPMEDARYILPLAITGDIIYKANLSSLRNAIAERTCIHAQTEIRDIFFKIKSILHFLNPIYTYKIEKCYSCPDKCNKAMS